MHIKMSPASSVNSHQWVTTGFDGRLVTGRILARIQDHQFRTLYEVELPLYTNGRMTRIVRAANELAAIEDAAVPH